MLLLTDAAVMADRSLRDLGCIGRRVISLRHRGMHAYGDIALRPAVGFSSPTVQRQAMQCHLLHGGVGGRPGSPDTVLLEHEPIVAGLLVLVGVTDQEEPEHSVSVDFHAVKV